MQNGSLFSAACAAVLLVCAQMPAHAQAVRTWVSGSTGDDAMPCSRTAPCKTFARAIGQTIAGGEISVADPGGYGPVTITKPISIFSDSGSGEAGIYAGGGINGIVVAAGPNDVVQLRGLVIDGNNSGQGPGLNGILFLSGGALHVSNTVIKNFNSTSSGGGNGILFQPNGLSKLYVTDTTVTNNGASSIGGGIMIAPASGGSANVAISRVNVLNNVTGITGVGTTSTGPIRITVRDTLSAGAPFTGISAVTPSGAQQVQMLINNSEVVNNATGVSSFGTSSFILLSESSVTANNTGIAPSSGGQINSYQTNRVNGNIVTDGTPTGTVMLK